MSFNSNLFFKAVSVLTKQKPQASTSSTPSTVYVSLPGSSSVKGTKKETPRKLSRCLRVFLFCLWLNHFTDLLEKFLNKTDCDLVTRARDVVANSVMAEIAKEDPQGAGEYQDALRHQIVSIFQRLRLHILVLDTLMGAYNASH